MRTPTRLSAIMESRRSIFTRLDRRRRGRADAPADRAPGGATLVPGLVGRPGDPNEVIEAWRWIMESRHDPVALILSRQNMATLDRTSTPRPRASGAVATSWPTRPTELPGDLIATAPGPARRRRPRGLTAGNQARVSAFHPGHSSTASRTSTATRSCRLTSPRASRSSRPRPSAGSGTPAQRAQ
jgi:hypothetical protein